MIKRYSRQDMEKIWTDETKYQIWFELEAYACGAMAKLGIIPNKAVKKIWEKGKFDINKINKIEKITKHDVIAFLNNISESIGKEARYIHQGMTSSDILDTTLSIQIKRANKILKKDLEKLLNVIKKRAFEHKYTLTVGRSHGIHAEPVTFGFKLATFFAEFKRNLKRLESCDKEVSTCAISGAVGTFANIDPYIEEYIAKKFDLKPEEISTQVIPRDRHAMYFSTLSVIASSVERLATEIRHLQRTEVREVEEYFSKGQKGSSAMPHKRNPVLSENLTGLARIVRNSVIPALENVSLWHERDISHSSVERIMAPDVTITLDFALNRLIYVIENMIIYPENMFTNIENLGGLIFSQQILLLLTQKGLSREKSYEIVQRNAMKVWRKSISERKGLFEKLLCQDKEVLKKLSKEEIKNQFNYKYHTKNIDLIFDRVFGK